MKYLVVVLLACALSACATLRHADGSLNVSVILSDAQWGIVEACSVEWLPADACTFGLDVVTAAEDIAASNLKGTAVAVRQLLVDSEAKLAPGSRLRPYLDAVIALLPVSA